MINRKLADIVKDQKLLALAERATMREACRCMNAELTPLAQVMTPNPIIITPDSRAIDALREMSNRGFRHLPVIEGGRICGVVSRSDFMGMEIDRLDHETHLEECIR
jgi:CBS domain-containing protein